MAGISALQPTSQPREIKRPQEVGGSMEYVDTEDVIYAAESIIRKSAGITSEAVSVGKDLIVEEIFGMKEVKIGEPPVGTYAESASLRESRQTALKNGQTEIVFNDPDKIQYQQVLRRIQHFGQIDQQVEQVNQTRNVLEDIRLEVADLSDEEMTEKGDYKNTSFKDRLSIRSVANRVWVFLKLVAEKVKLTTPEKTSGVNLVRGKTGKASGQFELGENELLLGGENKHHFTNAAG